MNRLVTIRKARAVVGIEGSDGGGGAMWLCDTGSELRKWDGKLNKRLYSAYQHLRRPRNSIAFDAVGNLISYSTWYIPLPRDRWA